MHALERDRRHQVRAGARPAYAQVTTGRIYEYFLVPADVAAQFQSAFSKGNFFNTRIRDKYTCREIRSAAS